MAGMAPTNPEPSFAPPPRCSPRRPIWTVVGQAHGGLWLRKTEARFLKGRGTQGHIARQDHHCDAAPGDGRLHGNLEHPGDLFRLGNQFAVVAALREKMFGMRLLEIAAAD